MWSEARRKAIEAELAEGNIPDWLVGDYRAMLAEIDRLEGLLKLGDRIAEKSHEIKLDMGAITVAILHPKKEP